MNPGLAYLVDVAVVVLCALGVAPGVAVAQEVGRARAFGAVVAGKAVGVLSAS